jgi:hypothetical protein
MLQSVYYGHPGAWTERSETAYQALSNQVADFLRHVQVDPQLLDRLASGPDGAKEIKAWNEVRDLYETFRTDRLLAYLRGREPNAKVGYSILIYYLDEHELDVALKGPASAWPTQTE